MIAFDDIQLAFAFVNSAGYGIHTAVLCKDTGEIFYRSEYTGIDDTEGKDLDPDRCVTIPHKNQLGLGQDLVFDFVLKHLPDSYNDVRQIFRRRGAYGRFKDLLEREGLLQTWYDLENEEQEWVLRRWCSKVGIQLSD